MSDGLTVEKLRKFREMLDKLDKTEPEYYEKSYVELSPPDDNDRKILEVAFGVNYERY